MFTNPAREEFISEQLNRQFRLNSTPSVTWSAQLLSNYSFNDCLSCLALKKRREKRKRKKRENWSRSVLHVAVSRGFFQGFSSRVWSRADAKSSRAREKYNSISDSPALGLLGYDRRITFELRIPKGGTICVVYGPGVSVRLSHRGPKKGRHETSVWHPCLSRRDSALAALSYKSDLPRLTSDPFVFSVVCEAIYDRSMNSDHSSAIARENRKQKSSRGVEERGLRTDGKKYKLHSYQRGLIVKTRWFRWLLYKRSLALSDLGSDGEWKVTSAVEAEYWIGKLISRMDLDKCEESLWCPMLRWG